MLKINIKQLANEGIDFSGKISPDALALSLSEPADNLDFNHDIEYSFHVSGVSDGILVAGDVSVVLSSECGRCLEQYDFNLTLNEICHFYEHITGHELDITDDIREDILINLPSKYLCSDKCKGLCLTCGKNLNKNECDCKIEPEINDKGKNQWHALDKLDIRKQ